MRYWFKGAPFGGILRGTRDAGEMQFWFRGAPMPHLFPAAAGTTLPFGWFAPSDRYQPTRARRLEELPALALVPSTLPPKVAGMGWFEPSDNRSTEVPVFFDGGPAFGRAPPAPTTVLFAAWFEPSDRIASPRARTFEDLPALALTPASLPPKIAGMAWFEPPEKFFAALIARIEQPVAFVPMPPIAIPVSGMAWYEPPDRDRPATKITIEAPPALALTPTTLPPKIAGIGWFSQWDDREGAPRLQTNDPVAPVSASQPFAGFGWFASCAPAIGAQLPRIDAPTFVGPRPVAVVATTMAWFAPPDRDRPPIRSVPESVPAFVLTPSTLPPKVSGMGWFQPRDNDRRSAIFRFDVPPALSLTAQIAVFLQPTAAYVVKLSALNYVARVSPIITVKLAPLSYVGLISTRYVVKMGRINYVVKL